MGGARMRIAIAQMTSHAGDFSATAARMAEQSRRAAERGVDLLVFPAPVLCGAAPTAPVDREGFLLDLAGCLMGLVDELACPCLVPVLTDVSGVTLPEALLFSEGGVVPVRLTAYLEAARARARSEEAADAPEEPEGRPLPELEFAGARLGVAFTYEDLDDYDDYEYDVDVIVFLSGYGFATDDVSSALGSSLADGRFLADAEATGAWIVGVGALGSYDAQVFCGSSFVLAPWGELAAQAPSLEEALLVCDLDPSAEGPLAEALLEAHVDDGALETRIETERFAALKPVSENAAIRMTGLAPKWRLPFVIARDELATKASVTFKWTPSPVLLPVKSQLNLRLNGELERSARERDVHRLGALLEVALGVARRLGPAGVVRLDRRQVEGHGDLDGLSGGDLGEVGRVDLVGGGCVVGGRHRIAVLLVGPRPGVGERKQ